MFIIVALPVGRIIQFAVEEDGDAFGSSLGGTPQTSLCFCSAPLGAFLKPPALQVVPDATPNQLSTIQMPRQHGVARFDFLSYGHFHVYFMTGQYKFGSRAQFNHTKFFAPMDLLPWA